MLTQTEQIIELNSNYNELGEDLVLLEAILQASCKENDFPGEYVASSLTRIGDYIQQHIEAIHQLAGFLTSAPKGRLQARR